MRPNTARFIFVRGTLLEAGRIRPHSDRKSTRLNSSHDQISYAVFCLKKKKEHDNLNRSQDNCKLRKPRRLTPSINVTKAREILLLVDNLDRGQRNAQSAHSHDDQTD